MYVRIAASRKERKSIHSTQATKLIQTHTYIHTPIEWNEREYYMFTICKQILFHSAAHTKTVSNTIKTNLYYNRTRAQEQSITAECVHFIWHLFVHFEMFYEQNNIRNVYRLVCFCCLHIGKVKQFIVESSLCRSEQSSAEKMWRKKTVIERTECT